MITIAIVVIVLISLYFYGTRNFKYWEQRGVKCDKPLPFFGNNFKGFIFKSSITQLNDELYWKYPNEPMVGFYRSTQPELIIRDPEIVKRILVTDFAHFFERGIVTHDTIFEPLMQNLFFAEGDLWKLLRQRMTPAFTTGKLKAMFPLIVERAERMKTRALSQAAEGKSIDARDLMARYTTDFIGAVGFGLNMDTLNEENSAFRQLGIKIMKIEPIQIVKMFAKEVFPHLFRNMKIFTRVEGDINELVGEILRQRNNKPSGRGDFIDLMLECKEKGVLVGESFLNRKPDGKPETVTFDFNVGLIAAQVFIFFAAGFETSSSASSFALHQLAYNPEAQKKAQDEVDRVLAKHDGKLSYESIKEMSYLEMVLKEGIRMFPSLGFLFRRSTSKFTFPENNVTIDENIRVAIPVQSLHNDPNYFPNPEEFKPERFDPEVYDKSNKFFYLPFGAGPRACIAERLGLMQSLAGLAAVVSSFTVEPAPETVKYPVIDPRSNVVQAVKGGLPLKFIPRNKTISTS